MIEHPGRRRRTRLAAAGCAALAALALTAGGATAAQAGTGAPVVNTHDGALRGKAAGTVNEFLGIPYAAPPTGNLRWRPPAAPAGWRGVRDATQFAASCPQAASPFAPPGPFSEDCLELNVYAPGHLGGGRPVLVWIHGGGLTQDGSRNYDSSKLAATGTVVVTINYRLGALGFLAHPALANRPGGPTGNYGLMDQQAALRWVRQNIAQFGGNPRNVTIAGQSAGGLSVLDHLVSAGSRGLFQRAIVQSGAFALNQLPLATTESDGEAFATKVGCSDQILQCLRGVPAQTLADNFGVEVPGMVDGSVLTEPLGTALAHGRFARVPILNGIVHDEELLFVEALKLTVSRGTNILLKKWPVDAANYQENIAGALGVSTARAAAIAAEYPPGAFPDVAFSLLVTDSEFACSALGVNRWTSSRVPTYSYQFNDDNAPLNIAPPMALPPLATHGVELPYIFDQPNAPFPAVLTAPQQALAAGMRAAWAGFAANGNPSTRALAWPSVANGSRVMSLVPPQPQIRTDFAAQHHCSFWGIA